MNKKRLQKLVNIFRYVPHVKVVAITGGPCAGKTTFLKMAIVLLQKTGHFVIVVPEIAREIIAAGILPNNPGWRTPTDFQEHIILHSLEKEASFIRMLDDIKLQKGQKVVILCDRGISDGAAYCGESQFNQLLFDIGLNRADLDNRYDGVIHLVTAAEGAPEFYVQDDERFESSEEAIVLDHKTRHAWHGNNHFFLIDNSTTFPDKIKRALNALNRIIPMPSNTNEIELKFFLPEFYENMIPESCKSSVLHQVYLDRTDRPGIECRVREKEDNGTCSYFYTEKTPTDEDGVRAEHEEQITKTHFEKLCAQYRNPAWKDIQKKRYKVPFEGHLFELDVYSRGLRGLVVYECEFKSVEEMRAFNIPEFFGKTIDVTADPSFSNANLAKLGMPQQVLDIL